MEDQLITRYYQEGDEEKIISLLTSVFKKWPNFDINCSPLEHWNWKYARAMKKKKCVAVTEDNGKIVATLSTPYTEIKFGEHIVLGRQGTDLAVHPDYRGRGLWKKLNEVLGSAQVSYNISGSSIVVEKIQRDHPPSLPGEVLQLIRIIDVDLHMEKTGSTLSVLKKLGFKGLKTIAQLKRKSTKLSEKVFINKIESFDHRINIFWEKISKHLEFVLLKDKDYLNWRYADPRSGSFGIYLAENNKSEVLGYLVVRINTINDYHEGYIVDLLALPGRDDVMGHLLSEATKWLDKNNVNVSKILVIRNQSIEKIAYDHGFIDFPSKHVVWFGKLEMKNEDRVLNALPERVQFQYGDTDWI